MSLQYEVDEVPEGLNDYYEQNETGSFTLKVEGVIPETKYTEEVGTYKSQLAETKSKLDEFRETNIALRKTVESSTKNTGDAETNTKQINELIDQALQPIKQQNEDLQKLNKELNQSLEQVVLSEQVKDLAIKSGVHETALDDIVNRSKSMFTVKGTKVVPSNATSRDANGNSLSVDIWMKSLVESAPHFFKESKGSGAKKSVSGIRNTSNLSSSGKIAKGLAARKGV